MNNCKVLLLWAVAVWIYGPVWGQEDSLRQVAEIAVDKEYGTLTKRETRLIISFADTLLSLNNQQALDFVEKVIPHTQAVDDNGVSEMRAIIVYASGLIAANELDSCISILKRSIARFEKPDEEKSYLDLIGNLYQYLGFAYRDKSDFVKASESFNTAAKYFGKSNNQKNQMSSKYNQANLLTRLENYRRAEKSYKELLDITDNPVVHGVVFSSLGILNMKQGKHAEALDFLLKSKALIDYASEPELIYLNLGIAYMNLERYNMAEEALAQAAAICKERRLKRSFLLVWNNFVKLYYRSGDLGRAREFLDLAEDQVAPSNLTEQAVIYEMKAKIYEEEKDWENALTFLKMKQIYTDSIESMEKLEAITEIETKYQTQQKELQNQALQRENELQAQINRNQRLGLGGLSLGLLALAGLSIFLYRQRQRIQAQKSEIELLHREQRHRMMNNLVFANSLMSLQVNRLKEQPEAQQAVKEADARLRAMSVLQSRLHHDGEGQKTVAIREYLEEITTALQRSFGSPEQPLRIHLQAPDAERVDGEAAMRIGLIVNELATNSCKHAFAEQPNPEINVALQPETEGHYRLIYTDNGSGLPADFQVDTKQSMGLFLIHNLVKQLNGRIAFSGEKGTRVECELDLKAA